MQYAVLEPNGKRQTWVQCYCGCISHRGEFDKSYFNEDYKKEYGDTKGIKERMEFPFRVYGGIIEDATYGRKFLDVGLLVPHAIKYMTERGWVSTGIDLIENEYKTGDFETAEFTEKFDLIHMGSVLESFNDPLKAIDKCYGMLNDGGVLFVETPCPDLIFMTGISDFGHWDSREKKILISQNMLVDHCKKAGFKVMIARRNINQRYTHWNNLHLLLQKGSL